MPDMHRGTSHTPPRRPVPANGTVAHFKRSLAPRLRQVQEFGVEFGADPSPVPATDAAAAAKAAGYKRMGITGGLGLLGGLAGKMIGGMMLAPVALGVGVGALVGKVVAEKVWPK